MVALAILSISLITLLSANNNAIALTAGAGDLTDAVTLARLSMEKHHLDPAPKKGIKEPTTHDDFPGFIVRAEIAESDFPDVSEVTVAVYKKAGEEERLLFTLTSHLSKEGGKQILTTEPAVPTKPSTPVEPAAPASPVTPDEPVIHTLPIPPDMPLSNVKPFAPSGGGNLDKR